ncbi:MAG TPA: hypothetical protein VFJ01_00505 [Oleiagrimonas sp.]|nr:hypothetical protein [Oleiagrimonas sp.]
MSDMPTPPASDDRRPRDSIAFGIAIAWIVAVLGHLLLIPLFSLNTLLLPEATIIILAVAFYIKGKTHLGHGLLLGLLSIAAVTLLLVAACFGLMV